MKQSPGKWFCQLCVVTGEYSVDKESPLETLPWLPVLPLLYYPTLLSLLYFYPVYLSLFLPEFKTLRAVILWSCTSISHNHKISSQKLNSPQKKSPASSLYLANLLLTAKLCPGKMLTLFWTVSRTSFCLVLQGMGPGDRNKKLTI